MTYLLPTFDYIDVSGGWNRYYPQSVHVSSTDWTNYLLEINLDPITGEPWTINGTSGISAFGYAFPADSGSLMSAHVSQLFSLWTWWPLRPITTLYFVKNGSIVTQAMEPIVEDDTGVYTTMHAIEFLNLNTSDTLAIYVKKTLKNDYTFPGTEYTSLAVHRIDPPGL